MTAVKNVARTGSSTATQHLPPHLREVCQILAMGVLRLRSRDATVASQTTSENGDFSLHFHPDQSGHAQPDRRRA